MVWNIIRYNLNSRKSEKINIFKHAGFAADVEKALKNKKLTREEFAEEIRKSLGYYFRAKSEWELIISPFTSAQNREERKVDVYDQVMLNWDIFINYLWAQRPIRKT